MRIMIFTQFFPPEIGATQTRLETFAAGLAARGHDVEVICEVPNHPQGVVREGFKGRPLLRRSADGYRVIHVWVRATPTKTIRTRLAFYGSFMALATLVGVARPRPDVILASSPPLPVAVAAATVAARHRVPWVMDVRDLWPAAAVALGELSNPRALQSAEWLERRLYASAAAVTVVTRPFEAAVRSTSPPGKPITVLPNGTTRFWLDAARLSVERSDMNLPERDFLWTYAGNVGAAQGLATAVDAAGLLGEGFSLLILGDGPERARLEQQARSLPAGSVIFRDQVSQEIARQYLRASDALLVPLADDAIFKAFVPSKLFDYCAVGRPLVVAAAGEPERVVREADSALAAPPGDAVALARAFRSLRESPALRRAVANRAREFAAANLREHHAIALERVLLRAAKQ
jgi:glycosyltransferase involved in cell wall biosynthesis